MYVGASKAARGERRIESLGRISPRVRRMPRQKGIPRLLRNTLDGRFRAGFENPKRFESVAAT
ncbi:hypothetical protein TC41_2889 [Alicyclobacillus acidocaldarius subsp. acidocaldarius Tc-4-1]|uniref:Uncharacterized protein n=1 Tax=Alicyclobacillus acidocaldarius (strain Tc-4-1) TaxID=1048834 RepID=F8IK74_ALIAT|nr:hypothetical protein TC41_2889 [Alicyclobacillus acidocaldarius subsp. acidocaldarius Tc-4-1]